MDESTKVRPLRGISIYLLGNILVALIPLALIPVLTRYLDPSEYGRYAAYLMFFSVFKLFCGFGVQGGVIPVYIKRGFEEAKIRFLTACALIGVSAAVFIVLIMFITYFWPIVLGLEKNVIVLAFAASVFVSFSGIYVQVLQVDDKPVQFIALQLGQVLIGAGITLTLLLLADLTWMSRVLGHSISLGGLFLIVIFYQVKKGWFRSRKLCGRDFRDGLSFGLPLIPHKGFLIMTSVGAQSIAGTLLGLESLGILSISIAIGSVTLVISDAFRKFFVPWSQRALWDKSADPANLLGFILAASICSVIVAIAFSILCFLMADFILGDSFSQAGTFAVILIIGNSFTLPYHCFGVFFIYTERTKSLPVISFAIGLISLVLLFISAETNGLMGLVVAMAVANVIKLVITAVAANRVFPILSKGIKFELTKTILTSGTRGL